MRVLWLCNAPLMEGDAGTSGTWLSAMACGLLDSGLVELGVVAPGFVPRFARRDYRNVQQWLVPNNVLVGRNGLPPPAVIADIVAAVKEFSPTIVHTWGTEEFWGLLVARGLLSYPALLEMQGLKSEIAKIFFGDLTLQERLRCIWVKEVYIQRTMSHDRRDFTRWSSHEATIIRGHRFVDVQSLWVAAHVKAINPDAVLFPTELALREPFYGVPEWQYPEHHTLFCTSAAHPPYKGLHVAVRALALLKKRIPDVRLRMAGSHQRPGLRQDGYMRWLNGLILKLDLATAITWLGPLQAGQIVVELMQASAVVVPTFIENCCTAMQEGMAVGTPVVASYAGGIPSLGRDEESCLFFSPGDAAMCARQLERLLTDRELSMRLSRASRGLSALRNDKQRIVQRQLNIYEEVINRQEQER